MTDATIDAQTAFSGTREVDPRYRLDEEALDAWMAVHVAGYFGPLTMRQFKGGGDHYANFIKAVRSRNRGELNADIEQGHLSSALCHTGNISHRLGQTDDVDDIRDHLAFSPAAKETFDRMVGHLAANGVDLDRSPLTLGAMLDMDPTTERFIGNDRADALLRRGYRYPFVVPEKV